MSVVSYSLKNGVNRTDNPTVGGVFAYGSYTSAGVFTLFDVYEYGDGTAFVSEPFDDTKPLVWKDSSSEYPQLGFENLYPNSSITPQPFPTFGIYLHPTVDSGVRKDVGVRVTIPFSGQISIKSIIQRADTSCGDDIGYRIMKNGVAVQARTFIAASTTPTTINTPANSFVAGDIIDFIVDAGSQLNWDCDDTALEITLNYQYDKIPTPVIDTTPINCSTTTIEGTTAYVSEGTIARLLDGTTVIATSNVDLDPVLYIGTYSFTSLDLTGMGGKNLSVVLSKSGDIDSDAAIFVVQNDGCTLNAFSAPVITKVDFCNVKCDYQVTILGSASKSGCDVVIFEYPYVNGNPVIETVVSRYPNWNVGSSKLKPNKKYVAFLLDYSEDTGGFASIASIECEANCVLVGELSGEVSGVTNGVIRLFESPFVDNQTPIANGVIKDGKFTIKSSLIESYTDYILLATKIN